MTFEKIMKAILKILYKIYKKRCRKIILIKKYKKPLLMQFLGIK